MLFSSYILTPPVTPAQRHHQCLLPAGDPALPDQQRDLDGHPLLVLPRDRHRVLEGHQGDECFFATHLPIHQTGRQVITTGGAYVSLATTC